MKSTKLQTNVGNLCHGKQWLQQSGNMISDLLPASCYIGELFSYNSATENFHKNV